MNITQNRMVIKVRASALTHETGQNNLQAFDRLACLLSDIQDRGYQIILVSSGAVTVGTNRLKTRKTPANPGPVQAVAAIGQCSLISLYGKFFQEHNKTIAQILLSTEDLENADKKDNLANTLNALFDMRIIPVITENVPVCHTATDTDNSMADSLDTLAAVIMNLSKAQNLISFSAAGDFYADLPAFAAVQQ